jgi:glycosyltransferase involved in cell wall biosynthesis
MPFDEPAAGPGGPNQGPLRVCLDARLQDGLQGGVQQVVIGLANGLSALSDGPEEYFFLVNGEVPDWLRPHLDDRCRPLVSPVAPASTARTWKSRVREAVRRPPLAGAWGWARSWLPTTVPESDGTVERAGIQVMHLTRQAGFRTRIPAVYMPYDLQHLHLPHLFSRLERTLKTAYYGTLCDEATAVVSISGWGKGDLVRTLGLPPEKIFVVPLAPAVDAYEAPGAAELQRVRDRLSLPEAFAYYPAQTWRHKNHVVLLEALAMLRDRDGLAVPVVCSGHRNDFFPEIERRARRLGLAEQVRFVGFVSPWEVQALYRLCRILVFPSLFEGFGMPVIEAFRTGVPVACSSATCLPEIAGGAAVLFDPRSPSEMAEAIRKVWTDPALQASLRERGRARAADFTWRETASRCRALYRRVGGRPLTEEDRVLLSRMAGVGPA